MNTSDNSEKILLFIRKESQFSSIDNYLIEISSLKDEMNLTDIEIQDALQILLNKKIIVRKGIGGLMIQLNSNI